MKKTFIVEGKGDWGVGIPPVKSKISIEDNIGTFDVDVIKKCLAEIYEDIDSVEVFTQEEYDKRNREMEDAFRGGDDEEDD